MNISGDFRSHLIAVSLEALEILTQTVILEAHFL